MNAMPLLFGLAVLAVVAVVPSAAADVTVCHYNWYYGCVGGERTIETDLVDCYLYVWIPGVDCESCPVSRCW